MFTQYCFTSTVVHFPLFTLLRYGDINPSTFPSKILMIFWALIGLVVFGLTMGVIGSGLTVNTQPATLQIYGTPVRYFAVCVVILIHCQLFGCLERKYLLSWFHFHLDCCH